MKTKECTKCRTIKELREFNTRPDSPNGYRSECKQCQYAAQYKREKENRYKVSAKNKARIATEKGLLKRPNYCMCCHKIKKLDRHHPNYDEPYYVLWICRKCHTEIHSIKGSYKKTG